MSEKTCPWCAEPIRAEARRCRHCGSRVGEGFQDPRDWHRSHAGRKLAGVCAAIARSLDISVTPVRAAFLLLALLHGFGIVLYGILWFLLPGDPGRPSGLDRVLEAMRTLAGRGPVDRPLDHLGNAGGPRAAGDEEAASGWNPTRS